MLLILFQKHKMTKFDELPERAIENTGYIRLETNGTKLLVTETFGVYKQTGVERIT